MHDRYGGQLEGLALSGMGHVTDTLWNAYLPRYLTINISIYIYPSIYLSDYLPRLVNAKILVMGTAELITTKIHVDHMIGAAYLE